MPRSGTGIGPAFGIRGYDNLFFLHRGGGTIFLREVEDGSQPLSRASYGYTMSSGSTYRFRVEVYDDSGTTKLDLTMIKDPGGMSEASTTLVTGLDIESKGYVGGGIGVAGYAIPHTRYVKNANLWIDDDDDDVFDDQVFSDDFASATVSPSYDDNGNLTDDGIHQYVYDAWNRLVEVRGSEGAESLFASYKYDATGRRIEKVVGKFKWDAASFLPRQAQFSLRPERAYVERKTRNRFAWELYPSTTRSSATTSRRPPYRRATTTTAI